MWPINLRYAYSVTLINSMGTFNILSNVLFVRGDIYELKSIKVFSYSKIDPAPVWLDSEMLKLTLEQLKKSQIS